MIVYIVKSAIILGILYSCYFIMLNKETFHRFNRMMLIIIMLLSLGLPLVKTYTDKPSVVNTEINDIQSRIETPIYYRTAVIADTQEKVSWGEILLIIYYTGVAISLLFVVIHTIGLIQYMRGGLCHTDSKGNTVILKSGEISPFSIFHYIVMSVEDYEQHRTSILTHEQEHIRLHHTYDLILLEVVKTLQWFNPFVWFLASNLKSVHEYEADEAVINQGVDAIQYQQLLVTKAVGNRLQPFANNLRRGSLKKRIIMMYQKKSNRWMMLKALFVIPVVLIAILAFATPKFVSSIKDTVEERNPSQTPDNKNTTEVADTCDAEIGIYLLTPEKIANLNETPEDSFLLDGKHISFEKFKKLDMDSIEHVGILAKSEESRDKQISGECKGRTFYVISKKMGISRYSKIEIRVNRQDKIMLGTDIVNLSNLSDSIKKQVSSPDRTIVSLEVSEKAPQSTVSSIKEILRKNGNLNIEYSVHKESDK